MVNDLNNSFFTLFLGISIIFIFFFLVYLAIVINKKYLQKHEGFKRASNSLFPGCFFLLIFFLNWGDSFTYIFNPMILAVGLLIVLSGIFKIKNKHDSKLYLILSMIILTIMMILNYFNAPRENQILFYILTSIMAVFLLISSYCDVLIAKNDKLKIYSKISAVSFSITFLLFLMVFVK